jgi:hypothetical protein
MGRGGTLTARGVVWSYGTDQPEELLKRAGWAEVRALQPNELGFAEGRWPYPPTPRHVEGLPRSYVVLGRKRRELDGEPLAFAMLDLRDTSRIEGDRHDLSLALRRRSPGR